MTDLRKAAQAVVDRWDTPLWKDAPATATYIEALRQALERPEQREWVELTDAEIDQFCNEWLVDGYSDIEEFVRTIMRQLKEKNT